MRLRFTILIFLFMLFPSRTYGMAGNTIVNPNVINISQKDYRGGNKNWDIAQDSKRVIYFANNDGLLEYDGIRWILNKDAACGLIRSVAVDAQDRIFTGGFEEFGVWERDPKGALRYRVLSGQIPPGTFVNEDIWRIKTVDKGVYFQSFAKIYYYDYHTVEVIDPGGFILFMEPVGDGFIMHSEDKLLRFRDNRLEELTPTIVDGVTLNTIRVILPYDEDGTLLLGTATQGFYLYKDGRMSRWGSEIDRLLPDYDLNCALSLRNGDYIFGTILNGIYRTNSSGRILNHFSTSNYLQNNTVLALFADGRGNIWVGLDKGITRLNYSTDFNFFIDRSGKIGSVYTAALHNDMLYIGSNRGLFYIPWGDFSAYGPLARARMIPGSQGQVWSLKQFGGKLLCGHNRGIMSVEGSTAYFIYSGNGVFDMVSVGAENEDVVLASSYSLPVLIKKDDSGRYRFERTLPGFSEPCQTLDIDHLGNIWLAHMTRNVFRCKANDGFSRISGFTVYGRNEFGTKGMGVRMGRIGPRLVFVVDDSFFLYNDISDNVVPYEQMNSLAIKTSEINRIAPLDRNYSWLIGKNSVTLLRYIDPQIDIVRQYDLDNFNVSTVDGFENVAKLNDTLSLICLDNGFLLHNIRGMRAAEKTLLQPMLKGVYVYDNYGKTDTLEIISNRPFQIPYKNNNLHFLFSYPDVSGNRVTLQYFLDDIVSQWTDMPYNADLRLERLPEGLYRLQIRAVDNLDNYGPEFTYSFRIMPPWYASWIAIVCYALLGIGIFFALWINEKMRLRRKHIRHMQMLDKQYLLRQNEALRNEVRERATQLFDVTNKMIARNRVLRKIRDELDSYKEITPEPRFPKKLYDTINKLIDSNAESNNDWKLFAVHFEQNYKGFFNNVKTRFPNLTAGDLKLCACLRLNLSTKDIASLLCISVRGVEIGRYRLRKKMGIDSTVNLNDYFIDNF